MCGYQGGLGKKKRLPGKFKEEEWRVLSGKNAFFLFLILLSATLTSDGNNYDFCPILSRVHSSS